MRVSIFSSLNGVAQEGEIIILTSLIEGFEGYEIMYQWECNKGDGFRKVEGANADSYSFTATEETIGWDWRLTVYYR